MTEDMDRRELFRRSARWVAGGLLGSLVAYSAVGQGRGGGAGADSPCLACPALSGCTLRPAAAARARRRERSRFAAAQPKTREVQKAECPYTESNTQA